MKNQKKLKIFQNFLQSTFLSTRWNGLNKSGRTIDALDDAEYSGSVISLIENNI